LKFDKSKKTLSAERGSSVPDDTLTVTKRRRQVLLSVEGKSFHAFNADIKGKKH